jgi:hypothetical protein
VTATLYEPEIIMRPPWMPDVPTAWDGVENILMDIFTRFRVNLNLCLDLGVQHGWSTAAFANYFRTVIGVDTFAGDEYAGVGDTDHTFNGTGDTMKAFPNVVLVRSDFRQWIVNTRMRADLIHVDLYHTEEITYDAGIWAIGCAPVVLFHDTHAFPAVMKAVERIAEETGAAFYDWPVKHGLGILVRH